VLSATWHKWTHPALTPAIQAGTWFTYPGGMEGWVDLVDLIAPRPEVEPATFRSRVRRRTAAPLRQLCVKARHHIALRWLTHGELYHLTWTLNLQHSTRRIQWQHWTLTGWAGMLTPFLICCSSHSSSWSLASLWLSITQHNDDRITSS